MSWMRRISQLRGNRSLSAKFQIPTQKIGMVDVSIECPFENFDRWWKYKTGADGWNDSQIRDEEAQNRAIEMEPDCILRISHEFAGWMPEIEVPERTPYEQEYETDAFGYIDDEMTNLRNDNYEATVKWGDLKEKIRAWLFMPQIGSDMHSRRISQEEYNDVEKEMSYQIFAAKEEIQQQYWSLTK